jgi:hypothetical protein
LRESGFEFRELFEPFGASLDWRVGFTTGAVLIAISKVAELQAFFGIVIELGHFVFV